MLCEIHDNCKKEALQKAKMLCHDKNLKLTLLRQNIFMLIWESHKPKKAYELIEKMSTKDKDVKPPIVYRILDFLIKNNLVHKLNSINSYIGCSHPLNNHNCCFLICEKCNNVSEFCSNEIETFLNQCIDNNSFQVNKKILEVSGICEDCR